MENHNFAAMNNKVLALLRKDILIELRQKHTFYGILLYIAANRNITFYKNELFVLDNEHNLDG